MTKLVPSELFGKLTLITNFMCNASKNNKTFNELLETFKKCYKDFSPENDLSNDLRILDFEKDMMSNKWSGLIILLKDNNTNFIIDGVHRGIAYLLCIKKGIKKEDLPEVWELNV